MIAAKWTKTGVRVGAGRRHGSVKAGIVKEIHVPGLKSQLCNFLAIKHG